jgi:hypothetical protein
MLSFPCPRCGVWLRVADNSAGKKARCGGCQAIVDVPLRGASLPSAIAPAAPRPAPPVAAADQRTMPPAAPPSRQSPPGSNGSPPVPHPPEAELYSFLAPPQAAGERGRLGGYRVLQVLGSGGMGVVFEAEDPQLRRRVALKALLPVLAASPAARQRFLREARAAAAVRNDHVVTIYQVGEDRGIPFLAMELLHGETLEARLHRDGRLPLAEVLRVGRETAEGLAAAHEKGLVHRDVKPANLWLEAGTGRVKILDFGLAHAASDDTRLTRSGALVGTPGYLAPEQVQGGVGGPRSDLFSLGCVLYRMAAGALPFRGTDALSALAALAVETPRPVRELNPEVPPALAGLVARLLAKDASARPASARAVADELAALEASRARQAPQAPAAGRGTPRPAPGQGPVPQAPAGEPDKTLHAELVTAGPTGPLTAAGIPRESRRLTLGCLLGLIGAGVGGIVLLALLGVGALLVSRYWAVPAVDPGPEREVRTLPSSIGDATAGGGGRYLILALPATHRLAVIDVIKADATRFIELDGGPVRVAAGLDKLVVLYPERRKLERWSLATLKKEAAMDLPMTVKPAALGMGCGSVGPVMVVGAEGLTPQTVVIDLRRMQKLNVREQGGHGTFTGDPAEVLASPEGRVFGVASTNFFSDHFHTAVVAGDEVTNCLGPGGKYPYAFPGPDGRFVCTSNGLYTLDGKDLPKGSSQRGMVCVPALQGEFYARVGAEEMADTFSLCLPGDDQELQRVTDVSWPGNTLKDQAFPCYKRLYLLPAANRIVSVPAGNDKVVLQRFDFARALQKATSDYLFVTSFPPPPCRPGTRYEHELKVQSRKGSVQFRLASGPGGMTISQAGKIRWDVPRDFADPGCEATVQIRDASGRELSQVLRIPLE